MASLDVDEYENFDFKENVDIVNVEEDYSIFNNSSPVTNGFHDNDAKSNNTSPTSMQSKDSSKNEIETSLSTGTDSSGHYHQIDSSDTDSLHLKGGNCLLEESGTEATQANSYENFYTINHKSHTTETSDKKALNMASSVISLSNGSGTAKARAAKSPFSSPSATSIPEEEINIPNDSNISSFTCDQLANFLRCFNVDKKIISHLYRKKVDGKRFSRLRDSELENLGMKNPVIVFFRNRSSVTKFAKKKQMWVL